MLYVESSTWHLHVFELGPVGFLQPGDFKVLTEPVELFALELGQVGCA